MVNKMTRKTKVTSALAVLAVGLAAPAAAELKYENATGGSVKLYGQFSPAFQSVNDGVNTNNNLVDNSHSGSRVGVLLLQPYDQGTFSFNFETSLGLRGSSNVSNVFTPDAVSWDRTNLRRIDFAFDTQGYGKFYAGQGSMATDGVAETDFSGTSMTTYNGISDAAGAFFFRQADGTLSTANISLVTPSFDGGRRGRIRYDTPTFSGFTVSVAAGQEILSQTNSDDYYDAAVKYANEFGGTKVAGAVGFSRRDRANGTKTEDTFGSVAVKLQSGLNFAFAAGSRKNSGDYTYVKAGYDATFFSFGETSVAIDYYDGNDFGLVGRKSSSIGIGVNQEIDSIGTQVYVGYRNYELSDPTVAYLDASSVLFGARWKF